MNKNEKEVKPEVAVETKKYVPADLVRKVTPEELIGAVKYSKLVKE